MRRGTTPIIRLVTERNWADFNDIWVTFEQKGKTGNTELTLKGDRVQLSESGTEIYVQLTQEETLSFSRGNAKVQVKGIHDGLVEATNDVSIKVLDILNEEVM